MNTNTDIALSSRVRMARNIKGMPFPSKMGKEEAEALVELVGKALNESGEYKLLRMYDLPARIRRLLVERHTISPDLARTEHGAAYINADETLSVMVGEEDHLRIQCVLPGLQLHEADEVCNALDSKLCEKLDYAFDERLGYLTACPTNIGSGMRASVMLHLPALSMLGQCEGILTAIGKLGYAVRGIYGEGSAAPGHIYQISNQMTLGLLEEDIISNLNSTVEHIIERERHVRPPLYQKGRLELEDRIYRSLGTLRYARKLQTDEAMEHISNLKLGVSLGILNEDAQSVLNNLLTQVQHASLEQRMGEDLNKQKSEEARAAYVRGEMHKLQEKQD